MDVSFVSNVDAADAAVVAVGEDGALSPSGVRLDKASKGALSSALKAVAFKGTMGRSLEVAGAPGAPARVLLVGVGAMADFDANAAELYAAHAVKRLLTAGAKTVAIAIDEGKGAAGDLAAHAALGARLAAYRFETYRGKTLAAKPDQRVAITKLQIATAEARAAGRAWDELKPVAEGVTWARDLVAEPPNVLHPEEFARRIAGLTKLGVEVTILGEKEMQKLGMGALLGVGQGSVRESQIAVMSWRGAARSKAPLALVGKGLCFDSGGISIKPADGMQEMKGDMAGAAAVVGAMHAIAARKAKANVVGLVGLVENMPDGAAQRPGDIVTSMSGQTIEIINTDAEGRLVLCDVLHYVQEEFKPAAIVDLATLTGAIIISLGHEHAGLFSNDDVLADALRDAGASEGEKVWRLPMGPAYDKIIDSKFADVMNSGGRPAGSITAAQFLRRFIKDGMSWAHLDIAGTAWQPGNDDPRNPGWASGWGVRLLNRLVSDRYED
jgi:leucyl aminopeptidase